MLDIIIIILQIIFIFGIAYWFVRKMIGLPPFKTTVKQMQQIQQATKITSESIVMEFFNKFEDAYLIYCKRNTGRFVMNKLIGKDPKYIFRIRKKDLEDKQLSDNIFNYTLAHTLTKLMSEKNYKVLDWDMPDISDAENPTIIKIIVAV